MLFVNSLLQEDIVILFCDGKGHTGQKSKKTTILSVFIDDGVVLGCLCNNKRVQKGVNLSMKSTASGILFVL